MNIEEERKKDAKLKIEMEAWAKEENAAMNKGSRTYGSDLQTLNKSRRDHARAQKKKKGENPEVPTGI